MAAMQPPSRRCNGCYAIHPARLTVSFSRGHSCAAHFRSALLFRVFVAGCPVPAVCVALSRGRLVPIPLIVPLCRQKNGPWEEGQSNELSRKSYQHCLAMFVSDFLHFQQTILGTLPCNVWPSTLSTENLINTIVMLLSDFQHFVSSSVMNIKCNGSE